MYEYILIKKYVSSRKQKMKRVLSLFMLRWFGIYKADAKGTP